MAVGFCNHSSQWVSVTFASEDDTQTELILFVSLSNPDGSH